ncbi:Uncharacterised protein [uncultured archaeon]|nr:Uncharacterised protein [uncultured archaeon]
MAVAAFAAPAMAHSAMVGSDGVDILGQGIFETEGNAFKFPGGTDTNYDSVDVGNDLAWAIGANTGAGPAANAGNVVAANELEIKKNQDSGDCACCQALDTSCPCQDCCTKYNVEQIKVGNRVAWAIGANVGVGPSANGNPVSATNTVRIITNQQ